MDCLAQKSAVRRVYMKVVLVKSPKILSGFLRLIFRVKKADNE
ncbi:MAG: stage V sporulation protein SpoVM [Ruminococcaceae bacterium]|nr:stage V sporulation protein SpoVM [Oscillospiraceae bacterium]